MSVCSPRCWPRATHAISPPARPRAPRRRGYRRCPRCFTCVPARRAWCAAARSTSAASPKVGWPVGFGDKTLLLKDLGAATSGTTKRAWTGGHHLIDPRTGLPARSDLTEVSVLASTATDAEIFAKVALLIGANAAPKWLEGRSQGWALTRAFEANTD